MTLKKYTMVIALVVVVVLFTIGTKGTILLPQNITNLLSQNIRVCSRRRYAALYLNRR